MKTTNELRQTFLEFFARHEHEVVPSSPLVPHNDPTLMFTNAGMVQFKNVFTGAEHRPYKRAASSQKCVRAGGKHNDLDNVGYTARHHTFFEMLGNFSFGDYFKERAIPLAWEFLTEVLKLPPEKLYVTVYHTDDEAFDLWKRTTGFPDEKILRVPTSDNFWAMGDTGPCGPCSEIFYDHGPDAGEGEWALDENGYDRFGERYVEIWNLVFMQYEQVTPEKRIDLPAPSVDTGMGLERVAAVMQGVHDNYEADLFQRLIKASAEASGTETGGEHRISHRVIADHLRSSSFLIADGVMPSNEGRGYVLRRIMRRAMRHAHLLGCREPLMYRLVPALVQEMGDAYPELRRAESLITELLKLEEERFKKTLDRGLKLLDEESEGLKEGDVFSGEVAFKLYDTYGFPLDLTIDILRARGIGVDEAGFEAAMKEQKDRARAAWAGSGEQATETLWFDLKEKLGATEFLGYQLEEAEGTVLAIVNAEGQEVQTAKAGDEVRIVTNQTPFYGESGGQVGDRGILSAPDTIVRIADTSKPLPDFHVHHGKIEKGTLSVGENVHMAIDVARRNKIRANHSVTHLLHKALRDVLGDHVTQKGSLVSPDYLRFDFSHPKAVTAEEQQRIESEVNAIIRQNSEVSTRLMTPDEAIAAGALALFGEKYGDEVRVLSMGVQEPGLRNHDSEKSTPESRIPNPEPYSVELCGGTHVRRTGDIGVFVITGESAISAGVRRIEALTGQAAVDYLRGQESRLQEAAAALKVSVTEVPNRVQALLEERKKLEKELAEARKQAAMGSGGGAAEAEDINGVKFIGKSFPDLPAKELRDLAQELRQKHKDAVITLATSADGKASLIVGVGDSLKDRFSAVDLVNAGAEIVGGRGGGRPELAQAGGADGGKTAEALETIKKKLAF